MDLRAVNFLWTSHRRSMSVGVRERELPSPHRCVQVRAARRKDGSGTGDNGKNNKNKINKDGDSPSGNGPSSPGMGDNGDLTNPVFDKRRRGSSKITLDWRTFRANLVAQQMELESFDDGKNQMAICNPSKKVGSRWAHPLGMVEDGCVLVATDKLDLDPYFDRSVVLLLSTTEHRDVPLGLILNQPFKKKMKHLKFINADLANLFAKSSFHFGGPIDDNMFLLKTDESLQSQSLHQVIPGICFGRRDSLYEAAELVKDGVLKAQDFRFFHGYAGWNLGQLSSEIESGYWVVAACSSDLLIGTSSASSSGLWEEILQLMGGPYLELSKKPKRESS